MPSKNRGSKTVGFGRPFRWPLIGIFTDRFGQDSVKMEGFHKTKFRLFQTNRKALRPNSLARFLFLLSLGTLVALIGQTSVAPQANGLYFGTGYNAAYAGGGGGTQNGTVTCATDMVAVGVGFTVNGNSPGFGIY